MNFKIENRFIAAVLITISISVLAGCESNGKVEVKTEDGLNRQEVQQMWEDL